MRWGRSWPEKQPRPKPRRLAADELQELLTTMTRAIDRSPILSAFRMQVRFQRSRFYLERPLPSGNETWARITPTAESVTGLFLEVERRRGNWSKVATGSALDLVKLIATDLEGTFHGLGSLERSFRKAGQGLTRQAVNLVGKASFAYAENGETCGVQEALFHYFELPVDVVAEPAVWYSYHRKPRIVEFSADRTRVLVRFSATSWSGQNFGGTCLYLSREGMWGAFPVKPSESQTIATAEKWLVKRKWKPWC